MSNRYTVTSLYGPVEVSALSDGSVHVSAQEIEFRGKPYRFHGWVIRNDEGLWTWKLTQVASYGPPDVPVVRRADSPSYYDAGPPTFQVKIRNAVLAAVADWADEHTDEINADIVAALQIDWQRVLGKRAEAQRACEAALAATDVELADLKDRLRQYGADSHGNRVRREGADRCARCGCKYWENDRCIDCGGTVPVPE